VLSALLLLALVIPLANVSKPELLVIRLDILSYESIITLFVSGVVVSEIKSRDDIIVSKLSLQEADD
jgi:hypothetical protein